MVGSEEVGTAEPVSIYFLHFGHLWSPPTVVIIIILSVIIIEKIIVIPIVEILWVTETRYIWIGR